MMLERDFWGDDSAQTLLDTIAMASTSLFVVGKSIVSRGEILSNRGG